MFLSLTSSFRSRARSMHSYYWWQLQFHLYYRIGKISESSVFKWLNHNFIPKCKVRIIVWPYPINNKSNCSVSIFCIVNYFSERWVWTGINHLIFIAVAALIISTIRSQLLYLYRKISGHYPFIFFCRNLPILSFQIFTRRNPINIFIHTRHQNVLYIWYNSVIYILYPSVL